MSSVDFRTLRKTQDVEGVLVGIPTLKRTTVAAMLAARVSEKSERESEDQCGARGYQWAASGCPGHHLRGWSLLVYPGALVRVSFFSLPRSFLPLQVILSLSFSTLNTLLSLSFSLFLFLSVFVLSLSFSIFLFSISSSFFLSSRYLWPITFYVRTTTVHIPSRNVIISSLKEDEDGCCNTMKRRRSNFPFCSFVFGDNVKQQQEFISKEALSFHFFLSRRENDTVATLTNSMGVTHNKSATYRNTSIVEKLYYRINLISIPRKFFHLDTRG